MAKTQHTHPLFAPTDTFIRRHIGPSDADVQEMLSVLGYKNLEELADTVVPESIQLDRVLDLGPERGEHELLEELYEVAKKNQVFRSYIGMGYYNCITPPVIQRNILESPGWYTQYTPYQAEISQGRQEALLNFQTMISDLTALPLANSSLLDEGTAAAEAMAMSYAIKRRKKNSFFIADDCHPQTIEVVRTRALPLDINIVVGNPLTADFGAHDFFGVLLQYPTTDGRVVDITGIVERAHDADALVTVATDLLALALLKAPGEFGADIAVGSSQRFGVPLGFGGPHAGFIATKMDYRRQLPGRLIGVSKDAQGNQGYRLSLQTREQHIRRDRATSNICTAQVLLAIMASMYGVYHGPDGIRRIAERVNKLTHLLADGLKRLGFSIGENVFFDTLRIQADAAQSQQIVALATQHQINLRQYDNGDLGVSLDESVTRDDLQDLLTVFANGTALNFSVENLAESVTGGFDAGLARTSDYLQHPVFNSYHAEHEMLRYIYRLQSRDLSLATSMIPLGSCTMKLNATSEMLPVTWREFGALHPFAPAEQTTGYQEMFDSLEQQLAEITGFAAVSLQPNAGSQGEYAGLMTIRAYHHHNGNKERTICLIPTSAHGTNPASAVMAGFKVVTVACNDRGDIDIDDLRAKAEKHSDKLGALMITYPSTHGVFEADVTEICEIIHQHGGQVYMDGANMNAQVGLCRPGDIGADVCHLNLHKTFCLAADTPVSLGSGTQQPIASLLQGQQVKAWSEDGQGIQSETLEAIFNTGHKDCVEIMLQDGRTVTCTPDHQFLTTQGWVQAQHLTHNHKVLVGLDAPLDHPAHDNAREQKFEANFADIHLSMKEHAQRDRCLAFFRLLGLLLSDGTHAVEGATGRHQMRVFCGTRFDAKAVVADIALLTGKSPKISRCNDIFSVRLPVELLNAFRTVPGVDEPGPRVDSKLTLPDLIKAEETPDAIIREFLGGLFGGDGCAPVILHLEKNPDTIKPVRFTQQRVSREVIEQMMSEIKHALQRLGVESEIGRTESITARNPEAPNRWRGSLELVWGTSFATKVGFRYCTHKSARLTAASAWWRMRETVSQQRKTIAGLALDSERPGAHWREKVNEAYAQFIDKCTVLNPYYAAFHGHKTLNKQHLIKTLTGQMGVRKDIRGLRRTHRRVVLPATNRHGESTGMPTLPAFLAQIGAKDWFATHTPGGQGYTHTYAPSKGMDVEPVLTLGVAGIQEVGAREVYDITVTKHHSFLANGVVAHNCIPHGGGGPGMGPIGVMEHLAPYLPGHPEREVGGEHAVGPISAAPYGSPSILPISWVYINLMGAEGLKRATQVAILSANYMAKRLEGHYDVLYTGNEGRVAHEFVLDARPFKQSAGIEVVDIAKRLMDYGYHAPTMSWPVPGTLMVEPTESESKAELDRFCDAMIAIRDEIRAIEEGKSPQDNNPLKHAPHTQDVVLSSDWDRPYSREQAAFPAPWLREHKFWPAVGRVDDAFGDRNLVCTCPALSSYEDEA